MKTALTILIEHLEGLKNNSIKHRANYALGSIEYSLLSGEIDNSRLAIDKAKSLLQNEKKVIGQAYEDGIKQHRRGVETDGEDYYNETFK